MKIDFDGIQAFVLVAELGGFSRAADHLHLTQTALTRRIQKLEAYLAVRLLDRTTRSVQLTAVGRDFLPQARRLVDEMTSAVERLKDMSRLGTGNVAIASIPTMAHHTLPEVIRTYIKEHPGNRIRIIESNASDVARAVLFDQAEFGITIQLERHADLVEEPVMREPFMFFCLDEHPLSNRKSVTWSELGEADLILVSGLSGNRALLDYQLAKALEPAWHLRSRALVDGDRPGGRGSRHGDPAVLDDPGGHLPACAPDPAREPRDRANARAHPPEERDAFAGCTDLSRHPVAAVATGRARRRQGPLEDVALTDGVTSPQAITVCETNRWRAIGTADARHRKARLDIPPGAPYVVRAGTLPFRVHHAMTPFRA